MKKKRSFGSCKSDFLLWKHDLDLSSLRLQPDAEAEIENIFYGMATSLRDSEMLVANNGLCLLIAFAQEQIQREARKFEEKINC